MLKQTSKLLPLLLAALLFQSAAAFGQGAGLTQGYPAQEPARFLPGRVTSTTGRAAAQDNHPKTVVHGTALKSSSGFLSSTTSFLDGYTITEYRGLVEGAAVRVPTWNEDAIAGVQSRQGGKIDSYTNLCEEARVEAYATMIQRAKDLGANGVVGIHFDSQVMPLDQGKFASGVVCVGTAVVVQRK